jgi:mpaB/rubber oxygenase-like protein
MHERREAERRFGDLGDRLVPYLERADPAADLVVAELSALPHDAQQSLIARALAGDDAGAPESLRALVESARQVPPWLDWARLKRANEVFLRPGLLGGLALGLCSLVHGYAAPAGNKPLAFSGRLTNQADRRLAETGKFVSAVTAIDGLRPGALGWQLVLRVRLMHAKVRKLVLATGRWSHVDYAHPINQHDMLATILLFSWVFVDAIRRLGVEVTEAEADDYQHLFRWVGELIGVDPELLPATQAEAERLASFIRLTQGPPDADSRALVAALLGGPLRAARTAKQRERALRQVAISTGLCRSLIGDELADALHLKRDFNRHWATGVRATLHVLEALRRNLPPLNGFVRTLGDRYWQHTIARGLAGVPARYEMPDALSGVRQ